MRIKVIPAEQRVVRDPKHGRIVPEVGSEVVATSYWRRLARDGDVTISALNADEGNDEE